MPSEFHPDRHARRDDRFQPSLYLGYCLHRIYGYRDCPFSNAALSFFLSGSGGLVVLDDISVEPTGVGVPDGGTTASLLGCALVGLAAVRRRLGC